MIRSGLAVFLLLVIGMATAQEPTEESEKRSRVTVAIGHMIMGQGIDDQGEKSFLAVPVWMIDYDYSINSKWKIGLHNDIITESFKVEGYFLKHESEVIERHYPVATVGAVSFKPGKSMVYSLGFGGEFSSSGNYFLGRLAIEYGIELPGDWELCPALAYDLKYSAYDSISIALGIGKKF